MHSTTSQRDHFNGSSKLKQKYFRGVTAAKQGKSMMNLWARIKKKYLTQLVKTCFTKISKSAHTDHNTHKKEGCPIAKDNGPNCIVIEIFEMVSDKAEMGCHGLVIVWEKAYYCFTWNDKYGIQEQRILWEKHLPEKSDFCIYFVLFMSVYERVCPPVLHLP